MGSFINESPDFIFTLNHSVKYDCTVCKVSLLLFDSGESAKEDPAESYDDVITAGQISDGVAGVFVFGGFSF